jgi:glutamyl-Q tRNA(Asp) synthetase
MNRGRFAPSPTGELHAGSLVAALASWLDAKAMQGEWWVRIEDVDGPRCIDGAAANILHQLSVCGLHSDAQVIYQSNRNALYEQALHQLIEQGLAYPCACTRKEIEEQQGAMGLRIERHKAAVYPGTCRDGLHGKATRAWRFNVAQWSALRGQPEVDWHDRRLGPQSQNVLDTVGDFVLKRADGLWAYQLAVVVDDAAQGITHVVRGEDLTDNTARQILLQEALKFKHPQYLHAPLVLGVNGEKLSKQNGAKALDLGSTAAVCWAMQAAASELGLSTQKHMVDGAMQLEIALSKWTQEWAAKHPPISP